MTKELQDIKDRSDRFRYKTLGDAISDVRTLLVEIARLEHEKNRLVTQLSGRESK